jgi:hypothetical protein
MKIRKYQKSIAVFLLLNFLNYLFLPTLIYAGSVTADEYDSFMPAGTTDMVNTMTGDFHYDVPLFDVPSPEGSYPIHLFYEAGIQTEKNATWTGLGWNLNVGAITREVNDIPDDMSGQPCTYKEALNPLPSSNLDVNAAAQMGLSIADQDAGHALYRGFQDYDTILYPYGILHADSASILKSSTHNAITLDCHALYSETETLGYASLNTPETLKGGSLPSYDQYNVTAEGLSGQIEPVVLESGSLFRSSLSGTFFTSLSFESKSFGTWQDFSQPKQFFRFKNEFSNSYVANANVFYNSHSYLNLDLGTNGLAYTYTLQDASGFNTSNLRLAGGKHVDYFTNSEIVGGTAKSNGFIDYPYYIIENSGYASSSNERKKITYSSNSYDVRQRIGGFSVTTEEGMTYHYALPVYTYGNKATKKIATSAGVYASSTSTNQYPYAYSWLLTTVTGPDYIDKNNNGYADEGDLGRWTNFNYGKATSNYAFKSPYSTSGGYYKYSNATQLSESGNMELYFLDAVYTRSHTALFSKASRNDALDASGASSALKLNSAILFHNDGIKTISNGMGWTYSNLYSAVKNIKAANSSYNTSAITVEDITTISGTSAAHYANQILKESKLTYDYSLCKNAVSSSSGNGKLTLLSARNYGKNNTPLAPSTNFQYELSNPKTATVSIISVPSNIAVSKAGTINVSTTPNPFSEGDIISFSISSVTYYAALLQATSSSNFKVMFLGNSIPSSGSATATQTKNPDYTNYIDNTRKYIASFADQWGYFKCDVILSDSTFNQDPKTSTVSGKAADCWSLRKISTGLGSTIEINYESDSYYGNQLTQGEIFNINQSYKYTNVITGALQPDSAPVCQMYKIDSAGLFEYSFREDIVGKFQTNQVVQLTTLATITHNGGVQTTEGTGPFQIFYIDESNRKITGKFIGYPFGTSSIRLNPMDLGGAYDTTMILYNNSSFLVQSNPTQSYGGGLRVSSITTREGNGETYSTNYSYTNRYTNSSSGTVPYIPIIEEPVYIPSVDGSIHRDPTIPGNTYQDANLGFSGSTPQYGQQVVNYQAESSKIGLKAVANLDFISPWVLYEFVTVSHSGNNNTYLKSEEYNYQSCTWDMIQRVKSDSTMGYVNTPGDPSVWSQAVKLTISDYTSAIGQLLNYSEYDSSGNMVSQTNYTYTSSPLSSQGRLDQVFNEGRVFVNSGIGLAIVTVNSRYSSVLSRVTSTDYLKNITSFKDFYKYDFYSGNPTETVTKNSEGDYFKQKAVPAYSKSQYAGMGLKFSSSTNKNMISPLTATYSYKVNPTNYATHIDTLSCSVNTWSNSWTKRVFNTSAQYYADSTISTDNSGTVQDDRIWRPQASYAWKSPILNADGSYKNFVDFNWGGTPNANWQKASTVTKYDQFSNAIEKQDINGNYTNVKYGYDLTYPLAGTDHANYNEFANSGAEDLNSSVLYGSTNCFGGEVQLYQGVQDTSIRHSGKSSLRLSQNTSGFVYKSKINATTGIAMNKPYRITAWIYNNGNTTAGIYYNLQDSTGANVSTPNNGSMTVATATSPVIAGQWQQLTLDFTLTGSYNNYLLNIGFTNPSTTLAYFDDFRFHPLSESISVNVYDKPSGQVTHSLDGNNFYSRRVYDNMYRPLTDYKETINGEVKTKEYQYNFGKRQ